MSDEIYGAGTRYVSKERLLAMLDCEYRLLLERLSTTDGEEKRFFAFADTVAARNYQGNYLRHHSTEPVRFVLSIAAAAKTLHEAFGNIVTGVYLPVRG